MRRKNPTEKKKAKQLKQKQAALMARALEANGPRDQLMTAVRRLVSNRPSVLSVEDHYAGYFNELGITLELESNTSDAEVALLKDDVASILIGRILPFTWMLSLRRNGKSAGEFILGDFLTRELDPQ